MSTGNGSNSKLFSVKLRPAHERGHGDHGWLNSYHTFSFADYYDPLHDHFHDLRVINEDRVEGGGGFPTHPHRDFEIFSYIVAGALRHKDTMGTDETMNRGDIQMTTAGTGIAHSEFNAHTSRTGPYVHFLQIWCKPAKRGVKPKYQWKHFDDKDKIDRLLPIVTESGNDGKAITINSHVDVYASLLSNKQTVTHPLHADREYYIHVVQNTVGLSDEINGTSLIIDDGTQEHELQAGDGAFIRNVQPGTDGVLKLTGLVHDDASNNGQFKHVEFLLFDLKKQK